MARQATVNDPERLSALADSGALEMAGDAAFERLVRLARQLTGCKIALISMVEAERQSFVGQCGLPDPWATWRQTPLSHSFCQHVVDRAAPLVVRDAREDPLVCDNAAVEDLDVVAYLGVPLVTPEGYVLGSLCAIEDSPRDWSDDDVSALRDLASSVLVEISLRHELAMRKAAERARDLLFAELNHRVRNLFTLVLGMARAVRSDDPGVKRFQDEFCLRLKALAEAHSLIFGDTARDGALGTTADVSALADAILYPIPGAERINRGGPPVELSSRQALYAGLLLHELGTNALKHGALSLPTGRVKLRWRREGDELYIDWIERGGPPAAPPSSNGFGSELIDIISRGSRRTDQEIRYGPEGLTCRLGLAVN